MKSHRSQKTNSSSEKKTSSPQSIGSEEARVIRGKQFYHNKQHNQRTRLSISQQHNTQASIHSNQHQGLDYDRYQKRSNRHVNTLDHRALQPSNKKTKSTYLTTAHQAHSSRDTAPVDSEYFGHNHQYRLRGSIKSRKPDI